MRTDKEVYLQELLEEIEQIKSRNGHYLYKIQNKLSQDVVNYIRGHFENNPEYAIEIKKCSRCLNTWDIIITIVHQGV